jgi:hypothetical protein
MKHVGEDILPGQGSIGNQPNPSIDLPSLCLNKQGRVGSVHTYSRDDPLLHHPVKKLRHHKSDILPECESLPLNLLFKNKNPIHVGWVDKLI